MKYIFIFLIKVYQRTLSRVLPPSLPFLSVVFGVRRAGAAEVRHFQGRLVDCQTHRPLSSIQSGWLRSGSLILEVV